MIRDFIKLVVIPVLLVMIMTAQLWISAYQLGREPRASCLTRQVDGGMATLRWSPSKDLGSRS